MKKMILAVSVLLTICGGLFTNAYATSMGLENAKLEFTFSKKCPTVTIKTDGNDEWKDLGFSKKNWATYLDDGTGIEINNIISTKKINLPGFGNVFVKDQDLDIEIAMNILFGNSLDGDSSGTGTITTSKGMFTFDFEGYDGDKKGRRINRVYTVVATNFTATPEPTTMLLFGIGLIGIAGISRKKTKP